MYRERQNRCTTYPTNAPVAKSPQMTVSSAPRVAPFLARTTIVTTKTSQIRKEHSAEHTNHGPSPTLAEEQQLSCVRHLTRVCKRFDRAQMRFYNFLSDEERRLFTTKPKEVTA